MTDVPQEQPQGRTEDAPHRAYEITVHVGADRWEDAAHELRRVADEVFDHGEQCSSVSGGTSTNHRVEIAVRPEQTHDKYFAEIDAWLASRRR